MCPNNLYIVLKFNNGDHYITFSINTKFVLKKEKKKTYRKKGNIYYVNNLIEKRNKEEEEEVEK